MRAVLRWMAVLLLAVVVAGCVSSPPADDGDASPSDPTPEDNGRVAVQWGEPAAAIIRPGASLGGYCTYNFLFTDTDGHAYIGTAGHCTEAAGERVTLEEGGPEIGTVMFDSDNAAGADKSVDFSLILLDPGRSLEAHPTMLGYDAPKGVIAAGEAAQGDQVALYGYGLVLGQNEATRPRFGVLVEEDGSLYRANMPAVNGDSGSPLIHVPSGKAFGIVSHYGTGATPPSTDEGPILPFILAELAKAGFVVEVATV